MRLSRWIGSPALTVACLGWLMALVVLATLGQVHGGLVLPVRFYIRSFFLWIPVAGGHRLPLLPGGASVGAIMLANLWAALRGRAWSGARGVGLLVLHAGIALLLLGEFVSWRLGSEAQLAIRTGETLDAAEAMPLGFRVTLKRFDRENYPGTDIPRSFSSLIHISDPSRGVERDALISMNSPLRYGGKSLYQAGYGMEDRLSVLQVVDNPGRHLPYAACLLMAIGLALYPFGGRRSPERGS